MPMHHQLIETGRLYLREMNIGDAEYIYNLNLDPEVIRYTGDVAFDSTDSARIFLEHYRLYYREYGLGRWAVIDKTNGEFLGWCGIRYSVEDGIYDIGFRLFRKHWNKGYATEAAKACVDYGFRHLKISEIIGRAMADNIGSVRVLEKAGLVFSHTFDFDGQKGVLYKMLSQS
jgi:ribosomal-protein-alanine N-acetyltransferase